MAKKEKTKNQPKNWHNSNARFFLFLAIVHVRISSQKSYTSFWNFETILYHNIYIARTTLMASLSTIYQPILSFQPRLFLKYRIIIYVLVTAFVHNLYCKFMIIRFFLYVYLCFSWRNKNLRTSSILLLRTSSILLSEKDRAN